MANHSIEMTYLSNMLWSCLLASRRGWKKCHALLEEPQIMAAARARVASFLGGLDRNVEGKKRLQQ